MTALTVELLDKLIKSAGYHRVPLRVTDEFYSEVRRMPPQWSPSGFVPLGPALPPMGPEVIVVTDGSENVKLVDGEWTFVPEETA